LWLPRQIYKLLCEGLAGLVQAIPVPDFISAIPGYLSAVPSGVAFFLAAFQFETGMTIIISAYLLRFVIRRIPFIG
jgi:hypothetical protein